MLSKRLLGLAVLLSAAALAWVGITKPDPFHQDEVVHVMFDHVQGIALVQRNVRVAGVNVGSIGSVRRVGIHAEVDLLLHQHIPVYRDARASLRPHTPFEGTTFVDLDPGTPGAGPLGEQPIPLARTTVFVSAGDVFSTFTGPVRRGFQVIVAQLSTALGPPAQLGLSTAINNAPALLRQTETVAPALRGPDRTELKTLLPSLAGTVDAVAGADDQLRSAVHDAARTLDAVTVDDAAPLDRSLAELPATLALLDATGRAVTGILQRTRVTAAALVPTLRQIPPTTAPLVEVFRRANPTLARVPPLVSEFAVTLRDLGRAAPSLGHLLGELGTIGQLLRYRLVPALDARSSLGLPTYLQLMAAVTGLTGDLSSFVTHAQVGHGLATGHDLRATLQGPVTLPLGALQVPCSAVSVLNPQAVTLIKVLGLCTP